MDPSFGTLFPWTSTLRKSLQHSASLAVRADKKHHSRCLAIRWYSFSVTFGVMQGSMQGVLQDDAVASNSKRLHWLKHVQADIFFSEVRGVRLRRNFFLQLDLSQPEASDLLRRQKDLAHAPRSRRGRSCLSANLCHTASLPKSCGPYHRPR